MHDPLQGSPLATPREEPEATTSKVGPSPQRESKVAISDGSPSPQRPMRQPEPCPTVATRPPAATVPERSELDGAHCVTVADVSKKRGEQLEDAFAAMYSMDK